MAAKRKSTPKKSSSGSPTASQVALGKGTGQLAVQFGPQVAAETVLRFGPQEQTLRQALADATSSYNGAVAAGVASAAGIKAAIDAARPVVEAGFTNAQGAVARAQDDTSGTLAGLKSTPQVDAIKAATSREQGAAKSRLATALGNATSSLQDAKVRAQQGQAFNEQAARSQFHDDATKIHSALSELANEEGAFAQGRSGQLVDAAQNRAVTIRGQQSSAATARRGQDKSASTHAADRAASDSRATADRASREGVAAAHDATSRHNAALRADGAGKKGKPATRAAVLAAQNALGSGIPAATHLKDHYSRSEAAKLLLGGRNAQPVYDGKGKPLRVAAGNGTSVGVTIPKVPKIDPFWASIALDVAYDKHVSARNLARLKQLGYDPAALGLPTKTPSQGRGARGAGAASGSGESAGGVRPG